MMPGIERLFQLCAPSPGNASPEFTSFFLLFTPLPPSRCWVSPVIRACLERFLIFLSVPPSQAVNFQRLRVKPRQKLREGRSEPPPCSRVLRLKGDGGWAGPAVVRQMQVVMGIDKATCVRERQSGVFAREGHNHDVVHKGGASGPLHIKLWTRVCVCVCGCGLISSQPFRTDKAPSCCFCTSLTHNRRIRGNTVAAPREHQRPFCPATGWLTGADDKGERGAALKDGGLGDGVLMGKSSYWILFLICPSRLLKVLS